LLDHQLLVQSHYRNSVSPSSTYSEDDDRQSEQSGLSAVNNLLGNTNSSSSANNSTNQFPFKMNGANNQTDLQQSLAAQQAANAAAVQLVRKLQQHNQLNNNSSSNNSALAAAAAQLSNSNASNALSNYNAFYNAATAALNSGVDLPLLGNINNLANSLKNSVNNSHALANVLNSSSGQTSSSNGSNPQSPYIATNQYTEITYKGQQVAAFLAANKNPTEYLLCLPQAFELFLRNLVGGLHTVYTKLKRLDIVPIVCNVEQVRILRGRGAIQPGVNRCKLLSTKDFDVLYKDCTTNRSGRPARPSEDANLIGNCDDLADCDASCDERQNRRVLARLGNRLNMPDSLLKRHKADLDNNMLPLLFANEDSGQGGTDSSHRSSPNGHSLLPAALRFAVRNSPGIGSLHGFNGNGTNLNSGNNSITNTSNSNQVNSNQNNSSNQSNNNPSLGQDLNATAAYLWLLSQQNRNSSSSNGLLNGDLISPTAHNNSTNGSSTLTNNPLSALNLTRSLSNLASGANTNATTNQTTNNSASELLGNSNNSKANNHRLDESTDDDADDDADDDEMDDSEIRSHSNLSNSIDNHQNLFNGFKGENRTETPTTEQVNNSKNQMNNILGPTLLSNNKENDAASDKDTNKEQLPFGQLGLSNLINNNSSDDPFKSLNRSNLDIKNGNNALVLSQNISSIGNNLTSSTDSLESLLRNIENLVSIAVQNARQQQQQLNLHKAELRAELLNVAEKERDFREQLERQLNEEQRMKLLYQKRFKKERRFRKKIEQDLQQVQSLQNKLQSERTSPSVDKSNGRTSSPLKSQTNKTAGNGLENGNSPAYGSPVSNENTKENSNEDKDNEMAID